MNLFVTGSFNTTIFRLDIDGCPRSIIPKIELIFGKHMDYYFPGTGDFAPDSDVLSVFTRYVINCWNYKTLAQSGTCPQKASTSVVYVDFATSVENVAYYLYHILCPLYKQEGIYLYAVKVYDDLFAAEYRAKG